MSIPSVPLGAFVAQFAASPLAPWAAAAPWEITGQSGEIVRRLLLDLDPDEYLVADAVAIHRSARIEAGAVLKGPLVIGPGCFVAAGAYLRGGSWVGERCTIGPGAELKSAFVFPGTTLAHFNFVGDSILGADVNLEAGSIICNSRNERPDGEVLVRLGGALHRTGCRKFGALVGDHARIGANAVIAPGALVPAGAVVPRGVARDEEATDS